MNLKVKVPTIIRTVALILSLCFAAAGVLSVVFAGTDTGAQIVMVAGVASLSISAAVNWWNNNSVSVGALVGDKIGQAINDGLLTLEDAVKPLQEVEGSGEVDG